jgi:AcrR family transcriptional regulator
VSPRTPEQNEQIRAATRERIVGAALALFAEHGYQDTSVRMIAEAAGVAQGLLYSHFEGKQALLHAIFEESVGDVRESFAVADEAPPAERLERLIRGSFEVLQRNLPFWRLSYGVRMQPAVLAGLGSALHEWTTTIRRTLQGYLRDAGVPNPDVEAAVLFALIDGISQHYVLDPQRYPLESVTELVVARFCGSRREAAGRRGRR